MVQHAVEFGLLTPFGGRLEPRGSLLESAGEEQRSLDRRRVGQGWVRMEVCQL
jgi:hypothetical protein